MRAIEFTDRQNKAIIELESIIKTSAIKDDSQAVLHIDRFNDRIAKVLSRVGLLWSLAVSDTSSKKMILIIFK